MATDHNDVQSPTTPGDVDLENSTPASELPMHHDSMVTVRLSEPPTLSVDTRSSILNQTKLRATSTPISPRTVDNSFSSPTKESAFVQPTDIPSLEDGQEDTVLQGELSPSITTMDPSGNVTNSPTGQDEMELRDSEARRGSDTSGSDNDEVNWEELAKTEEKEPRNESSDDSTALLLARLEQENNLLATNPKSGIAKVQVMDSQGVRKSRPVSIQHLKKLVASPTPPALRYSVIPPPPMTDLEFYAALVQDYTRTAQSLPTLMSKKIRGGIPPPLRGVVWQSMSGARNRVLGDQYDTLCGETSPYENIIGKDLGRSFPGVEMFRDPDGDGQRMLGRVLKCFSLYDTKIGYCQGLGFIVGPLLMHMGDKEAFCVLVRLMEQYDLRACFLPDLSGLHVRIYQFRELLKRHLPELSARLDFLQIDPSYVSQWFLSFFAVTCPLPMLFRIYDVIFAEGASETLMRVALSLMRKNEQKIMACTEFEDVMQLLLSRGLWDVYPYNGDDFVNDFVSLTGVVTHESLQALETSFKAGGSVDSAIPSETVGSAASGFLGRLWAGSNANKSISLSPGLTAPARPISFLRRSPSKQSIASTLNSMEGGASDSMISQSTDATSISRDSSNADGSSIRAHSVLSSKPNKDQNLHSQIEDLLTALSEMQRDHAALATQLQREREERDEDRQAVKSLLDGLRKKTSSETINTSGTESTVKADREASEDEEEIPTLDGESEISLVSPRLAGVASSRESVSSASTLPSPQDLSVLLDIVEERFGATKPDRRSSLMQSKSELRIELARTKERLDIEMSKPQELTRQIMEQAQKISEQAQEISNLRDQVKEGHVHARNAHAEKQRLEKQIHNLRTKQTTATTPDESKATESEWPARSSSNAGLREFRLGRTNSNRSIKATPTYSKRTSSLNSAALMAKENQDPYHQPNASMSSSTPMAPPEKPEVDNDALLLELVQAKTNEAVAKQEAEEAKAKLENLKKMLNLNGAVAGDAPSIAVHRSNASVTSLGGYMPRGTAVTPPAGAAAAPAAGFWGGWGKRTVSSSGTPSG